MLIAIEITLQALEAIVQSLPLGTNLALLHTSNVGDSQ